VAVIGCAVNAAGQLLWFAQIQASPAYLTHLLPAQLLGGAGVGLAIPSLLAAGSAALTPARFGAGSGILNTARQVGTVLGVAGLVAILTHVSRVDPIASYRHGLILIVAFFAAAGVIAAALLTRRPSAQAAPAAPPPGAVPPAVVPSAASSPGSRERAGQPGLRALGNDATTRS
jgi:MFS family permease